MLTKISLIWFVSIKVGTADNAILTDTTCVFGREGRNIRSAKID